MKVDMQLPQRNDKIINTSGMQAATQTGLYLYLMLNGGQCKFTMSTLVQKGPNVCMNKPGYKLVGAETLLQCEPPNLSSNLLPLECQHCRLLTTYLYLKILLNMPLSDHSCGGHTHSILHPILASETPIPLTCTLIQTEHVPYFNSNKTVNKLNITVTELLARDKINVPFLS